MGTHPNAMLILVLTPDDLSRKTHRAIMTDAGIDDPDDYIKIGDKGYHHQVFEGDYDESHQITAPEGSIVFHDLVTYGYGEVIEWDALQKQKDDLEAWAKVTCERHRCSFKIVVSANYW